MKTARTGAALASLDHRIHRGPRERHRGNGSTLYFQPGVLSAVPVEAAAEATFKIEPFITFEFDVARNEMTIIRGWQKRVFTKEK
jgi:hypothetical protein